MSDEQATPTPFMAAVDQIWAVYQRFRSLGASESEAARLAEAVMSAVAGAASRAGKPS
jgi:hypothetical protein